MLDGIYDAASFLLSIAVERYLVNARDRLQDRASALSRDEKSILAPYFAPADVNRIRVLVADPLPVRNPPFVSTLRRLGYDFPGLEWTAAMTLDDVIVSREQMPAALLFHEAIHSSQARILGLRKFAYLYVRGFLTTRSYHDIPLERCAFHLENRFLARDHFKAEEEIRRWFHL